MAEDPLEEYIRLAWKGWAEAAFQTQKQLIGWLFTLHGAGIAATLGYANSKGISSPVVVALVCFVLGIVCLLIWGTLMYYFSAWRFQAFKQSVAAHEEGKITDEQFIDIQNEQPSNYRSCEIIAWISGLAALSGLTALIIAVLNAAPAR